MYFSTFIYFGRLEAPVSCLQIFPSLNLKKARTPWTLPSDLNVTTAKIADNAVTLAKMAGGTDGNLISYDANGDPVAVATGNAGQVLTSAGAGAPPTFQTASSISTGKVFFMGQV